jgi:pantothenate kinase
MQAGTASSGKDTWGDLVDAATVLASHSQRRILGITGPPGAGKSVLAQRLTDLLVLRGHRVALAAMDGFHLANAELARLGRTDRKGAPDTFDASGYLSLLARLRPSERGGTDQSRPDEDVVYAPIFDRAIEAAIGGAVAIGPDVKLVITEGNYLLHQDGPWSATAALLDECWYVELDERLRTERLIARHIQFGRSRKDAVDRAQGSDLRNARLVARTKSRASRIVTVPDLP